MVKKELRIEAHQSRMTLSACPKYLSYIGLKGFSEKKSEENKKLFEEIEKLVKKYNLVV